MASKRQPPLIKTPLKPFSTALLTALAAGELHAYAIEQQMVQDARGAIPVRSWAVYRELPRLIKAGVVEAVPATRPARYRLTKFGRTILASERAWAEQIFRLLQART
jgi:DNA-binding PadR family transcriptional regulator